MLKASASHLLASIDGLPSLFCVVSQCNPHVKQHASLAVGTPPTPTLLSDGNASIFQAGNLVFAPRIACACVRRPKTQGLAISRLLREPSKGAFYDFLFPLWPRCARHRWKSQTMMFARVVPLWVVLLLARCLTVWRIDSRSNALQGAGHAVLRTLYSRAHRIVLERTSCLLRDLCKSVSLDLSWVALIRVLA